MISFLLDIDIATGPFAIGLLVLAAVVVILLVVLRPSRGWRRGRWAAVAVAAIGLGAGAGALTAWLLSDVADLFHIDLTPVQRGWAVAVFAGTGLAAASMVRATWRRVVAASLASILFLLVGGMQINATFGQYPTVRSIFGLNPYAEIPLPSLATPAIRPSLAAWTAPADMPAVGTIASVRIPNTASGFVARDAVVYLPPAALTAAPPLLPVLIVLSGQPGSPQDPLTSSHLAQTLNAYAAAHQGLAPIVVSPDQLGSPQANPMCIDSPLGKSATYLTVDVPAWIRTTLPVLDAPQDWGIGGLSQGGTCAIQLGAAHPELFSAILDAAGEEYPTLGDDQKTIDQGFGGDAAAYAAAYPAAIMAAHTPYTGMFAVFGAGTADTRYRPGNLRLFAAAQAAGMDASYVDAQGSGHDTTSWGHVFEVGVGLIADHWGLGR